MGAYLPGGVEPGAGTAAVRLDPARRGAAGGRPMPVSHQRPRRAAMAGGAARTVGPAGAAPSGSRLRQLVEPRASRQCAKVQETRRQSVDLVSRAGAPASQVEPYLGAAVAA